MDPPDCNLRMNIDECLGIMRKFPVGKLKESKQEHLGVLINRILNDVFRPFLEKWSGSSEFGGQ